MIDWVTEFSIETATFNSILGIALYWLPLFLCFVGYTLKTARNLQKDKRERTKWEQDTYSYYVPTDTIGDLIGRAFISIIPIGNLWAAVFDISPMLLSKALLWVGKTFDQPLVPKREKQNETTDIKPWP